MTLMIVGLVLNSLAALSIGFNPEVGPVFASIMMAFWAVSMLGVMLIMAGKKKVGAIVVVVGAVAYVPLGLVAVFGARKVLESIRLPAETPA